MCTHVHNYSTKTVVSGCSQVSTGRNKPTTILPTYTPIGQGRKENKKGKIPACLQDKAAYLPTNSQVK